MGEDTEGDEGRPCEDGGRDGGEAATANDAGAPGT